MAQRRETGEFTTIVDVRSAINDGNMVRAVDMLSHVLRTHPNAEAWYTAAAVTADRDQAMDHLQRALLADPTHKPSLEMLRRLGGTRSSALGLVSREFQRMIYSQSERSVLLRHLPRRAQLLLVGLLPALVVLALGTFLLAGALRNNAISSEPPPTLPVRYFTSEQIIRHVSTQNLPIARISRTSTPNAGKHILRLEFETASAASYAEIVVYDTIPALIQDQAALNQQTASNQVVAASNAVLIVSRNLSDDLTNPLVDVFSSLPQSRAAS